jgi:hypothetical protein
VFLVHVFVPLAIPEFGVTVLLKILASTARRFDPITDLLQFI